MSIAEGKQSIKNIFIEDRYFEIPNYQRSYAWDEKQLKDFLDDFSHIENYKKYFYGTILLQQKENCDDSYEIVDGQQRITTLIIFMKCLIKHMKQIGLLDDAIELEKKYIKYKNTYILKLQDQDDGFFKSYILYDNDNFVINTPAQKKLIFAKKYFDESLKGSNKDDLLEYKTRIQVANCLVYSVSDRNEAAMIFETTNDRGKMLTNLEKTKSYLMYKVSTTFKNSNSLINTIQQGFNEVYATYEIVCEKQKFNLNENSIQQYVFIAFENWQNKKENGKTVKAYQHYFEELKSIINSILININSAEDETSKEKYQICLNDYIEKYINQLKGSFNAIRKMFEERYASFFKLLALDRMASIYPLLIKAYTLDRSSNKENFLRLCYWCEIFCFRGLTIIKYQANKYQDTLFALARDFNGDFVKLYEDIIGLIVKLGDNDKFLAKLENKEFFIDYASQDRNYFFWSYENYLREKKGYPFLSFEDLWQTEPKKKLTIEHIVAQADSKDKNRILKNEKSIIIGKRSYFDKEYLHSIGNLTIDPLSANAGKGKKEFAIKNSKFFTSAPLMSQNELDDYLEKDKWTINSIEERKRRLIEFARKTWCFDYKKTVDIVTEDFDVDIEDK